MARLPRAQGLDENAAFHLLLTVDEIAALQQELPPRVDPTRECLLTEIEQAIAEDHPEPAGLATSP